MSRVKCVKWQLDFCGRVVEIRFYACGQAYTVRMRVFVRQCCNQLSECFFMSRVFLALEEVLLVFGRLQAARTEGDSGVFDFCNAQLVAFEWLFVVDEFYMGSRVSE